MERISHWIKGRYVSPTGQTNWIEKCSPTDGKPATLVPNASGDVVDEAVEGARNAFDSTWSRISPRDRSEVLLRVARGIRTRFDDFVEAETADTGRPSALTRRLDVPRAIANFEYFATLPALLETRAFHAPAHAGVTLESVEHRVPRGVVAAICPWNLPILLLTWKVAPAMACGNTVVVKPSELTPRSSLLLAEVMQSAGVPDGVYNVVHGGGADSAGQYLAEHSGINAMTFTGSTSTGQQIMRTSADYIRPVSLELGGKNAAVIFEDCDLDAAVAGCIRSAFENCGQVCLGTERIYVHRAIFDSFVERFTQATENLTPGRPESPDTTLGPLISKQHKAKVLRFYALAKEEGAKVLLGGGEPRVEPKLSDGYWIEPTIWTGLSESSAVNREEIFGPCCHITSFEDEHTVIDQVNNSDYGLSAVIWTKDFSRGHRVSRQITAGVVWINSWFLRDLRAAFGGTGRSGLGREGGIHSVDFFTEIRTTCMAIENHE